MKKITVLVMVLVLCVMASNVEQSFAQKPEIDFYCIDACSTGCVSSYAKNRRDMSRCLGKCQIRCGPDS